jgi:hypothetical protein
VSDKPKRRWYQFSLKAMILAMVVCGCGLGPIAYEHQRARNQHAAVAALEKRGGYLGFDSTTHPRSTGMGLLLGDDKFAHLVAVDFAPGSVITDADVLHMRPFSHLRFVGLDGMPVTDASLAELGSNTMLTELSLKHTKVTDAGLDHLAGLARLDLLWLEGTSVTDAGVQKLQRALPNVRIRR